MILLYFLAVLILIGGVFLSPNRPVSQLFCSLFYLMQAGFAVYVGVYALGQSQGEFFTFDSLGVMFFALLALLSPVVCYHADRYIEAKSLKEYKIYNALLMALCTVIAGVYFANNLAVNWIFLEATSICTAALIYFRGNKQSLEATWKYIFVCSVGITIAYLGVLLMSTVATNGQMSYDDLVQGLSTANPLYLRLAFVFMIVGYSSKMEVFPLYTAGIDANSSVPTPISALISTALVNAGFVSLFRVFRLMSYSDISQWCSNVLLVMGIISLVLGAFFMRRTNNYKRFLSYSTLENMGIVLIGLGVGGLGLYAALLHITAHTLIKSGLMLEMARIGKSYGNYRINRIGACFNFRSLWGTVMIVGMIAILAFPPSPLFFTEMMILRELISQGNWALLVVITLLICIVIYSFSEHILRLCFKSTRYKPAHAPKYKFFISWSVLALFALVFVMGLTSTDYLVEMFKNIANF